MAPRGAFLALVAKHGAPAPFEVFERHLRPEAGWTLAGALPSIRLWTDAPPPYRIRSLPNQSGLVIGDVFPTPGAASSASPFRHGSAGASSARTLARDLCRSHWGGYVAFLREASGGVSVFRDPGGQVGCLAWPLQDGVTVVASNFERTPAPLRPRRLALNWDRIGRYVGMVSAACDPLFDGVEALGPGELWDLTKPRGSAELLWAPADFVAPAAIDLPSVASELVTCVDRCTAELAAGYERLIVELSGGLDSSIVAAALGNAGLAPRVMQWLNYAGDRPEGDERDQARAVAERLGVALTVTSKPLTPLVEADFQEMADGFWPGILSADASRDRDEAGRVAATGAQGLVSGQGGDAVFFQMPTALVWADELNRRGLSAITSPVLADVARRTHQSVWGVLRKAWAARSRRAPGDMVPSPFVSPEVREASARVAHPWVSDARSRGLPPAKQLQVNAIANCQVFYGASRRAEQADLLYPLMSQPVVELCLSIATPDLAGGSYDRPFARAAFAERLPQAVLQRCAKGNMTGYFNRLVAASADMLRPYLLDGCLCEARVLDRRAVAAALEPSSLIWTARANGLLTIAAVEAWVRHWQARIPDAEPRHRAPT